MTPATMPGARVWTSHLPDVDRDPVPLPRYLLEHARLLGDKPALVDGPTGRALSYRQLADGVERDAAGGAVSGANPMLTPRSWPASWPTRAPACW
jgi:hypothetical protein